MKNSLNNLISNGIFDEVYTPKLNKNSYANIFEVVNKGENSYFNLCKGVSFKNLDYLDSSLFSSYMIQENDSWTNISYKFFHTVELWWLICKFNEVKNPFKELTPGTIIRIPSDDIKDTILNSINVY